MSTFNLYLGTYVFLYIVSFAPVRTSWATLMPLLLVSYLLTYLLIYVR
jgi:hypothetical protein